MLYLRKIPYTVLVVFRCLVFEFNLKKKTTLMQLAQEKRPLFVVKECMLFKFTPD